MFSVAAAPFCREVPSHAVTYRYLPRHAATGAAPPAAAKSRHFTFMFSRPD
jgi:hypothetical protein